MYNFLSYLCKVNFKIDLDKYSNAQIFQTIKNDFFRVGAEMGVIFMDSSREKSLNPPLDSNQ